MASFSDTRRQDVKWNWKISCYKVFSRRAGVILREISVIVRCRLQRTGKQSPRDQVYVFHLQLVVVDLEKAANALINLLQLA